MAQLTRLDAVNRILRANGEQPVSSLVTDATNDTSIAEAVLDETITQFFVQYGEEVSITLEPDTAGKIRLSSNIVKLDGNEQDRYRRLSRKGSYLWDVDNNTEVFDDTVYLRVIYQQEFVDLDPAFQYMIVDQAAEMYQADVKGDPQVDQRLRDRAMRSKAIAMAKLTSTRNRSWLNTTDLRKNTFRYEN